MIKISDAELKGMFDKIMEAIQAGHLDPNDAASLKEAMKGTLMDWLAEKRETTLASTNYKALIVKKASK